MKQVAFVDGCSRCGVQLAAAQGAAPFAGRLVNSLSGDPVAGAVVVVEGQNKQVTSAADGSFTLEGLAPGTYHLIVKAQGYSDKRTEVTVTAVAPATPADRAGRSGDPLRGSAVGVARGAQPARCVPADQRAGRAGADQAARHLIGRDAAQPAGGGRPKPGRRAGAAGRARPGRRPRADPAGRPAHRRPVEPVVGPRRVGEPGRGPAHRGGARPGHAALRRERHRRAGQRDHRRDSVGAAARRPRAR